MPRSAGDAATSAARPLWWACLSFVALGVALAPTFRTALMAPYREAMLAALGAGPRLDPALEPICSLLLGITGGSIVGKWIAHAAVVRYAVSGGERWARNASLAALLTWFLVDSAASIAHGAVFNVVLINWVPLLGFGMPLLRGWRVLGTEVTVRSDALSEVDSSLAAAARLCQLTSGLGLLSGLLIAGAGTSALFQPWREGLAAAYSLNPEQAAAASRLTGFFVGPIGGSVAGQFVLLAAVARHAIPREKTWAVPACVASLLGWFVVDSGYGLAFGGGFNILMVNVPTLIVTLPALLMAGRRQHASRGLVG